MTLATELQDTLRHAAQANATGEHNLRSAEITFGRYPEHPAKKPCMWVAAEQAKDARELFQRIVLRALLALR